MTHRADKTALERETAAAIFNRINKRRAEAARPVARSVLGAPDDHLGHDNLGADHLGGAGLSDPLPPVRVVDELREAPPVTPHAAADRFPRSATMRLVLKHPALVLGLGVPAAGLLLKSPAARRLLGMALRAGVGEEIQSLVRQGRGQSRP